MFVQFAILTFRGIYDIIYTVKGQTTAFASSDKMETKTKGYGQNFFHYFCKTP
jgi:hypothetical protein